MNVEFADKALGCLRSELATFGIALFHVEGFLLDYNSPLLNNSVYCCLLSLSDLCWGSFSFSPLSGAEDHSFRKENTNTRPAAGGAATSLNLKTL